MNTNPLTKGVVSENFKGVGTVTDEMVEKRAVELALINGRAAKDVSEDREMTWRFITWYRMLQPLLLPRGLDQIFFCIDPEVVWKSQR